MHDIVKNKLPSKLAWGKNIDMDLGHLDETSVVVLLCRLPGVKFDNEGKITNEEAAIRDAEIKSGDVATPSDPIIDLSKIPPRPTKHFPRGTYALKYTIQQRNTSFTGYQIYRDLE